MKKPLIILFALMILLVPVVTAEMTFDNIDSFDEKVGDYGKYTIRDNFGINKLLEIELKENTEICEEECYAIKEITLHQETSLVDNVRFYRITDGKLKETRIRDYEVYVLEKDWRKIDLGEEFAPGTYQIKLIGYKKPSWKVDWQIKTNGLWTEEWAVWGSVLDFKQNAMAYWSYDDVVGNNSPDATGNENNGTILDTGNITCTSPGKIGNACTYSGGGGANSYIEHADDPTMEYGGDGASWSGWAQFNNVSEQVVFFKKLDAGNNNGYNVRTVAAGDPRLRVNFRKGGVSESETFTTELTESATFVFFTLTYDNDSNTLSFYANGAWLENETFSNIEGGFGDGDSIMEGGSGELNASVDEWAYWNKTLSPSEINSLYAEGRGLQYPFYQGNVTLNSPADDSTSPAPNTEFNCTAEVNDGSKLANITLFSNSTGTWGVNGSDYIMGRTLGSIRYQGGTTSTTSGTFGTRKTFDLNNSHFNYVDGQFRVTDAGRQGELRLSIIYNNGTTLNTAVETASSTSFTAYNVSNPHPEELVDQVLVQSRVSVGPTTIEDRNANVQGYNSTTGATAVINMTVSGAVLWTCQACDSDGDCGFATQNFTVSSDGTAPVVNVTSPIGVLEYQEIGTNLTFNWTASDQNLDTCWYDFRNTNTTVTCADNSSVINITDHTDKSLTFWANDTFGNQGYFTRTWDYKGFLQSKTYETTALEGSTQTLSTLIITNGTVLNLANLSYNGTKYTSTITNTGNNYTISNDIVVPLVSADTNVTFYWEIEFANPSQANTSSENQTIVDFAVDDCSSHQNVIYNFTVVSEKEQTFLEGVADNVTLDINMQFYSYGDRTALFNYTNAFESTNPNAVCFSDDLSDGTKYNVDVQAQYDANGYAPEFYHVQNGTVDNTTINNTDITLYDLNDSDAQEFKITYKDGSLLPVDDALIQIQRKYIDEGVFKVVEIPKTDSDGSTLAHLALSDVVYTLVVIKNGVTLATFDNILAVCNNVATGDCEINLNAFSSAIAPADYSSGEDFTFTLTYDESTREFETIYSIPSGTPATVLLNVTLYDALGTSVCTDTLTSAGGTLDCVAPTALGNGTAIATVTKDGAEQAQAFVSMAMTPEEQYGANLVFLGLLMFLTLVGVGVGDSPIISGFFVILGAVLAIALNLFAAGSWIGAGSTIIWLAILVAIIIYKGGNRV